MPSLTPRPSLPRPKRGQAPADFYERYVPELWRALMQDAACPPWHFVLEIDLGDAGGPWFFDVRGAALTVTRSSADAPHLRLQSNVASFEIAMLEVLPRVLKHFDAGWREHGHLVERALVTHARDLTGATFAALPGTLRLAYVDDAGDEAHATLTLGAGRGPTATLRASDTELWRLLAGGAGLAQLLTTRIQIGGDVGYVLRLTHTLEGAAPSR